METLFDCLGEELYEKAAENSVLTTGLGKKLRKIFSGKKLRLAFLGGSVTYGYNSSPENHKSYADFLYEHYSRSYEVEMRNFAVSGTNCYMGLFVDEMLLKDFAPRIVFVEYSINEELSPLGMEKYESLLRRLISRGCAVIPITVFNRAGYSCEEYMTHFSRLYGLPTVGIKAALYPLIQSGKLPMDVYTPDEAHPRENIHEFIAKCIVRVIDKSIEENSDNPPFPAPLTTAGFEGFRLLDLSCGSLEKQQLAENVFDFAYRCKEGERIFLETEAECSKIVALYLKDKSRDMGECELFCDGKSACRLSGYSIFGWGNPFAELVFCEDKLLMRKIRLEIPRDCKGKRVFVIATGCC